MALGLQSPAHVGEGEVGIGGLHDGERLDTVALVLRGGDIEGIVENHIIVEGAVTGTYLILRHRVIEGCADLCLFGEELTQFERGGDGVVLLCIRRTLHDALLQTSEAVADIASRHVHIAEVGELHLQVTRGRPAAVVVALHQSQLVDPHLTGLHLA